MSPGPTLLILILTLWRAEESQKESRDLATYCSARISWLTTALARLSAGDPLRIGRDRKTIVGARSGRFLLPPSLSSLPYTLLPILRRAGSQQKQRLLLYTTILL